MKLGIATIIKDESRYLEEWVLFHKLQGFDRFYIYNNDSEDIPDLQKVIHKLGTRIWIELIHWPGKTQQYPVYEDALKITDVDWMAFIDADEFLWSPSGFDVYNLLGLQLTMLEKMHKRNIGAVTANWRLYGTSGHKEYEPGLVIERFTARAKEINPHVKSIVRPEAVEIGDVHQFKMKEGFEAVAIEPNALVINHYHTKSAEEYRKKCARGRADIDIPRNFEENLAAHDVNDVRDFTLRDRYADKIKQLICR